MDEEREFPLRIPVLPYRNRVLLPGGVIRVVCTSPSSMRLVETQLWHKGRQGLVGLVPAVDAAAAAGPRRDHGSRAGSAAEGGKAGVKGAEQQLVGLQQWLGVAVSQFEPLDFAGEVGSLLHDELQWHRRGVLARALHVGQRSRGRGGPRAAQPYTVVLEGLQRFEIVHLNSRGPFHTADVTYLPPGRTAGLQATESSEEVKERTRLERELLRAAAELSAPLAQGSKFGAPGQCAESPRGSDSQGSTGVTPPGERSSSTRAAHLADVLVACFETEFEPRLAMLDAVDEAARLGTAVDILQAQLQKRRGKASETAEGAPTNQAGGAREKQLEGKSPSEQAVSAGRSLILPFGRGSRSGSDLGSTAPNPRADNEDEDDVAALECRMEGAQLPENVWRHVKREIRRLRKMQPHQPGYSTAWQYLELIAELPWATPGSRGGGAAPGAEGEPFSIDLAAAKELLDREHFGLEKVKQRIVEYIAVRKLKPDAKGPILCFVGPPGVGKTSLAASIATALGRKFVRIALGGVKDEADVRGHRRTYVGSMPGRVIEGIKRAGVANPVMLLDELDKTGTDARGDPASALLEVLDPEQNKCFTDHYVGLPFDLSGIIFLATANRTRPIPAPLLDRMEVIEIPGYTPEEKKRIAVTHLIPRTLEQHGLTPRQLCIPPHIVDVVIQRYTREAGVRNLSRHLAALARAAAVQVAKLQRREGLAREVAVGPEGEGEGERGGMLMEMEMDIKAVGVQATEIADAMVEMETIVATEEMVEAVLGPSKFDRNEVAARVATPGVAVGLVWTAVGGEVQFVEASKMAGKGELHLTGQLGDVIKESAQIALTWVRSHAAELHLWMSAPEPISTAAAEGAEAVSASRVGAAAELQQCVGARVGRPEAVAAELGMLCGPPGCSVQGDPPRGEAWRAAPCPPSGGGRGAGVTQAEQGGERWLGGHGGPEGVAARPPYADGSIAAEDDLQGAATSPAVSVAARGSSGRTEGCGECGAGRLDLLRGTDIHIHFPAGAVPKDGPSAGVTLVTALVSLLTQRCVRADTAMTGEITLRGLTLPVGGIKEKILAAHRCGIRRVILPHLNLKEVLQEVPAETLACMEILPTRRLEEVLQEAFEGGVQWPSSRL